MLTTGTASKVVACNQNTGCTILVAVRIQNEVWAFLCNFFSNPGNFIRILVPKFGKCCETKTGTFDGFQEFLWNNHISINVLDIKRCCNSSQAGEWRHSCCTGFRLVRTIFLFAQIRSHGSDDWSRRSKRFVRKNRTFLHAYYSWVGAFLSKIRIFSHISNGSSNRSCCCHGRGHEMSSSLVSLSPFKVAIGGGCTSFLGFQLIFVHCQAHGATRFSPIKPCFQENLVEPFIFGLFLHQSGPWYNHRMDSFDYFAAKGNRSYSTHIFNPSVGA
mmetsp:Transcript_33326/g.51046  ORF Transcript_33326/g.51046 Transcript_33326/m.51046 type:complete len:273 (+) Transcript_33326:1669-2487(+)